MSNSVRVGRVRNAIAAAALALVVVGGPMAGPAAAANLDEFSSGGEGFALRVILDLRPLTQQVPALGQVLDQAVAAIPGAQMATPGVIDQTFIKTSSDATANRTRAKSALASGFLNLESVEATEVGQTIEKIVQGIQIPSATLPLISGAVGELKAAVGAGPGVQGNGTLESISVGLPLELQALDGVLDQLTAIVDDLLAELQIANQLTDLLDPVLGSVVCEAVPSLPIPSLPVVGELLGGVDLLDVCSDASLLDDLDVSQIVDQIVGLLRTNLLEGTLADLEGLVNLTGASRVDGTKALAQSSSSLQSLSVLGGVVEVGVLNLSSQSEASGTPGSAKNLSACSIADVKVGGEDGLAIAFDGTSLSVGGTPVPVAGELVGQVKGLVDEVLGVLGISVGLCDTAQSVAEADGSAAAQRVSALHVEVAPLGLFRLVIDPTVETSVAARVSAAPATPESNPPLPMTGAGMAATALMGIGLAAGALFARRRWL